MKNDSLPAEAPRSTSQRLKIFISSPGGLAAERKIAMTEIRDLFKSGTKNKKPTFSIVRWPETIGAGVAEYGQSVINRQTADHDILICLIGARMGSPTPRANSGTEEEFDGAIEARLAGKNIQVLLFFSNMPIRPNDIDPHQLMLVRAFREKAGQLGVLYHTFRDHKDLRRLLRTSLRSACTSLLAKTPKLKIDSKVTQRKVRPKSIILPDIDFKNRATAPQAADVRLIPIAEYRRNNIKLVGTVIPSSTYLRFGFKYFESREQLFSAGSIQTIGQNVLVHIGRNKDDPTWFVTEYRAGHRVGKDRPIAGTENKSSAEFALEISAGGNIQFFLDSRLVYSAYLPIDGLPTLAILAWGDENDFKCEVKNIKLEVRSGTAGTP